MRRSLWVAVAALAAPTAATAQWRVAAPSAAVAWFAAVDSLRLPGRGAFPFTRTAGAPSTALGRRLAAGSRFDILHFVPLYYPSASQDALADAVVDAAERHAPRAPRARFVVGALEQAVPNAADRQALVEVAALARRLTPPSPTAAQLAGWQDAWTRRFAAPLAPFLAGERLDGGALWIIPSLGAEGRVFAGVPADRFDNIIAVGTPFRPGDDDGPLFAAVRELCFPLVSRVADGSAAFARGVRDAGDAARRTSVAAVRCGADLLERLAPQETPGYRAHWLLVASARPEVPFDVVFPQDPVLNAPLRSALPEFSRAK